MTELERRALLGDKDAQRECTEKGIVLACPFCGETKDIIVRKVSGYFGNSAYQETYKYLQCRNCFAKTSYSKTQRCAIMEWNTRPAPPIGRCGECKHWYKKHCAHGTCATEPTKSSFYCGDFEPKEREENAVD